MIAAPRSSSACWVRDLTEACVPAGMKNGVWTVPCGVVRRQRRAPVGSLFDTTNDKLTNRVYQRKIHAIVVNSRTMEKVVPNEIPSALPKGAFFGSEAEKPIAIRMTAQIAKRSKLPKRICCQMGALSPRKAAIFDAKKFCGSMLCGSFRNVTGIAKSSRSDIGRCAKTVMANAVAKFVLTPPMSLKAPKLSAAENRIRSGQPMTPRTYCETFDRFAPCS